jgi:hypothetical protein
MSPVRIPSRTTDIAFNNVRYVPLVFSLQPSISSREKIGPRWEKHVPADHNLKFMSGRFSDLGKGGSAHLLFPIEKINRLRCPTVDSNSSQPSHTQPSKQQLYPWNAGQSPYDSGPLGCLVKHVLRSINRYPSHTQSSNSPIK